MILNIYKEKSMTSRDVVNKLVKHFNTKKIGHTGTLDPIAEGVLIVCTDKDTKLVDILTSKDKEYIAEIKLGIKTDTGDITGNIIEQKDYSFNKDELLNVLNSFLGKSVQEVPAYSAIKVNGKKLYEYARENKEVELPKREIEIYNIELIDYKDDIIKFKVKVSKGTYIRSLINDICLKLNTVGTMESLVRIKQGNFDINNSYKLNEIINGNYKIIEIEDILKDYEIVNLNDTEYVKVSNGVKIPFESNKDILYLKHNNIPVALYKKDNNIYRMYIKF